MNLPKAQILKEVIEKLITDHPELTPEQIQKLRNVTTQRELFGQIREIFPNGPYPRAKKK